MQPKYLLKCYITEWYWSDTYLDEACFMFDKEEDMYKFINEKTEDDEDFQVILKMEISDYKML